MGNGVKRYEDQPAEILFRDLFDLGKKTTWTVDDQIEYDADVAAIKIAVIREASIGTFVLKLNAEPNNPQNCIIQWNNCPNKPGVYAIVATEA